jgi:hypothetical protein
MSYLRLFLVKHLQPLLRPGHHRGDRGLLVAAVPHAASPNCNVTLCTLSCRRSGGNDQLYARSWPPFTNAKLRPSAFSKAICCVPSKGLKRGHVLIDNRTGEAGKKVAPGYWNEAKHQGDNALRMS